jgi:hypothetical protein
MKGVLAVVVVAVTACTAPEPRPVAAPNATSRPSATAPAAPSPSVPPELPETTPAPESPLRPVLTSAYPDLDWAMFDEGALLAARSFVAVVRGDTIVQKPEWLAGLPEWINWDTSVYVQLPPSRSPSDSLPVGTSFSAHAGNRHGPDVALWWNGSRFAARQPAADRRLAKLPRSGPYVEQRELALADGGLVVLRVGGKETEAFVFPSRGAKPTRTVVPMSDAGYRLALMGRTSDDVYLCDAPQGVLHFDGKAWAEVEVEKPPGSCALTRDGALYMVSEEPHPRLLRRDGSSWVGVALPEGLEPSGVAAGGNRLFVKASKAGQTESVVLSDRGVAVPLSFGAAQLPGPLWVDGITGLDVSSVDVVSVSAEPAGPGTSACTSLVLWLGTTMTPELRAALGSPLPRIVEVSGVEPGRVAPTGVGANMGVQPSKRRRAGVAVLPPSYDDAMKLLASITRTVSGAPAKLVCATPRITRDVH